MATRHQARTRTRDDERLGAYDAPRPMPDEALLGPAEAPATSPRDEAMSASGLNVIAGIWLIISPFILNAHYTITPSMFWSNIFAGAVVAVLGLAALGETRRVPAR